MKLKVLREIDYVIHKHCEICVHGVFRGENRFGSCALRTSHLAVYRFGVCQVEGGFKLDEAAAKALGPWSEFVDRRTYSRSNRHKAKTRY